EVFGIQLAQAGDVVVCEGELDAMACFQHGITNAVAVGGSSVSNRQKEIILSRASSVTFFFDDDEAGRRGVWGWQEGATFYEGAALKLNRHVPTRVVIGHEGDPASMDTDTCRRCVDTATPVVEHVLETYRTGA